MMQIVILIEFLWKKVSVGDKKFLAIDDCCQIHLLDLLRHDKKSIIDACSDI